MLLRASDLQSLPVVSLHTGQAVSRLTDPIINPHSLEIVGWYCQSPKTAILLNQDIRQLLPGKAIVDSIDVLGDPEDLIRLEDVLKMNFSLLNKPVETESKHRLGKIEEYTIDNQTYEIQKLYVKQPVFKSLTGGTLIVDRRQIVEVSDEVIVVSDTTLVTPALAPQQAA